MRHRRRHSLCGVARQPKRLLLEFTADFGELDQAGLHGKRQLAGGDHQTAVFVGVVRHWDSQSSTHRHVNECVSVLQQKCSQKPVGTASRFYFSVDAAVFDTPSLAVKFSNSD